MGPKEALQILKTAKKAIIDTAEKNSGKSSSKLERAAAENRFFLCAFISASEKKLQAINNSVKELKCFELLHDALAGADSGTAAEKLICNAAAAKYPQGIDADEAGSLKETAAAAIAMEITTAIERDDAESFITFAKLLSCIDLTEENEIFCKTDAAALYYSKVQNTIYEASDKDTKREFAMRTAGYAAVSGMPERRAAEYAVKAGMFEGAELWDANKSARLVYKITAIALPFLICGAFAAVSAAVFGIGYAAAALLCIFPIFSFCRSVGQRAATVLTKPHKIPSVKDKKIPESAKTLVVITTLLSGKDGKIFEKAQSYANICRDENIYIGIAGDLPEALCPEIEADGEIIQNSRLAAEKLNSRYNGRVWLGIRSRSRYGSTYSGHERKRGALLGLCSFLRGQGGGYAYSFGADIQKVGIRYILTLDCDIKITYGAVEKLVRCALHPSNIPVIKEKQGAFTVVSGYGIFVPKTEVTVGSSSKTLFSLLTCGNGGTDAYSGGMSDFYQNLFREGNYCGKGLFDIDIYLKVLRNAFPEGRILSHDLLEGTRLRAAAVPDAVLLDECPSGTLQFFKREERWIRGDAQSLPFAFSETENTENKKIKNPANRLSRYKLADNIIREAAPVFSFAALMLSALLSYPFAGLFGFFALLPYIYDLAANVIAPFFSRRDWRLGAFRMLYSYAMPSFRRSVALFFYELSALPVKAATAALALSRGFVRGFITHKNCLMWKTSAQCEKEKTGGIIDYIDTAMPAVISGFMLLVINSSGWHVFLGVLFVLYPFYACFLSENTKSGAEKKDLSIRQKIAESAADMWKYFADNVTQSDNWLPPDNRQFSPYDMTAHRTSPTNIGMYLISCLAAADLGLIGARELYQRLYYTFASISSLEKYKGHLYNWYDTKSQSVIGDRLISGNLEILKSPTRFSQLNDFFSFLTA